MTQTEPKPAQDLRNELGSATPIIDRKALLGGLLIGLGLLSIVLIWKLAPNPNTLRRQDEFEFSVAEPEVDDFELTDPIRDLISERSEEMMEEIEEIETPNVQISVDPTEVVIEQPIVQSTNVDIEAPQIDIDALEVEIEDTPLEISETSDDVQFALNVIAAETPKLADIFKYQEPSPPDRPQLYTINRAPQPSRTLNALPKAFGDQDAPTLGKLGDANINLFGTSDFMRTMERAGGAKTKAAVDAALHWLAVHQESDGHWNAEKYKGKKSADTADTGLAVLAFLGAGHTTRKGEYRRNVLRGLEEIMRRQNKDGLITQDGTNLYTHGICTIALCEGYGRAADPRIGAAAQKAIRFCEQAVNSDGGWRYTARSGSSDMSVTAWYIQALKTAKLAHIKFDNTYYSQGLSFLDSVTDQGASRNSSGAVGYTFSVNQKNSGNSHPALTAAGMMVRQISGTGVKNHLLVKGANLTKAHPPAWNQKDFYYWYYATYAMHNMGGEYRIWWNQRIRNILVKHQSRDGDNAGSWDPKNARWGQQGGRVYTTALGALCLEVYYRYSEALNSFGTAPDLDELFFE
jgi:hypothetical protein